MLLSINPLAVASTLDDVAQRDGGNASLAEAQRDLARREAALRQGEEALEAHRQQLDTLVAERTLALSIAKEAAESANRAKSQFLATMSHELRTPMNGVLGMAQLLLAPEIGEAERRHFARIILNSGQTLLALLNDILDFSKIEAGKLDLLPVALEPKQIIEEATTIFVELARTKGLQLEATWLGLPGQRYRADPIRLRQMLSNLISNAIKFTAHGFVRLEASEVERAGDKAVLKFVVADSGIGIAPDKQSGLFQPFSQVDSSTTREYGGTGLGLSIVRTLAQLMGGDVGVDSEAGKGSKFWFCISVDVLPYTEERRHAERDNPGLPESKNSEKLTGRVLVVEDMPNNRKLFDALLRRRGLQPDIVDNGLEAIAAVTLGAPPDLVLMDVQMPVMDGLEATRRIRLWEAENGLPRLPIIAVTANAFAEDRDKCMAAGMDDFLTKPITPGALYGALAKWLPSTPAAPLELASLAAPIAQSPDVPRVVALLDEIVPMLAADKYDAIVRYRELQQVVTNTGVASEIDEIGELLTSFRFDLAAERLRRIAATQAWGIKND